MNEKNNIFLIGFMGCGKSAAGRRIARVTGRELIEMDDAIENRAGMTIPEIFERKGEPYFRDLETEFLKSLKYKKHCVVSCGGGAAMREENVRLMKESGTVVLLTATPQTVYERVRGGRNRPVLAGRMNVRDIGDLMEKRRPYYESAADCRVKTDGKTVDEVSAEILKICENGHLPDQSV